ncbi:MAG TPA: (4Fe-4S)-binding protein [Syntrophomonadaceae bacterium]|nr:(4Fe-4S)-binding protein [Syntrophomonadaceae bacterium]
MKKITEDIFWVGVEDPNLEFFDITFELENGTSYNAYLVKGGEKNALIDTVKSEFFDEYIQKIKGIIPLEEIDYLIMNHTEPDHSGSVEKLIELIPDLTVVGSGPAIDFLNDIMNIPFKNKTVGYHSTLDLGGKTLRFISALLLHWPDALFTYVIEDQVLFSCDSFGSHYSSEHLFADQIEYDIIEDQKLYFDMIMAPFSHQMLKALDKLEEFEIKTICPGHGPILRKDIDKYLNLQRQWALPKPRDEKSPKIVLVYVSAYGYTEMIAHAIEEGLKEIGSFNLIKYDLEGGSGLTEALDELKTADGLLVGSPTINKDALPPIGEFLSNISAITHLDMPAAAFGSYGWSGEAVPHIEARLKMLRMKVLAGLRIKFKPSSEEMQNAIAFGRAFGRAVRGEEVVTPASPCQEKTAPHLRPEDYPKQYKAEDLIVYWNPAECIHDTQCFIRTPQIFDVEARPWFNREGNTPEEIIKAIDLCPSGALKYSLPEGSPVNPAIADGPGAFAQNIRDENLKK